MIRSIYYLAQRTKKFNKEKLKEKYFPCSKFYFCWEWEVMRFTLILSSLCVWTLYIDLEYLSFWSSNIMKFKDIIKSKYCSTEFNKKSQNIQLYQTLLTHEYSLTWTFIRYDNPKLYLSPKRFVMTKFISYMLAEDEKYCESESFLFPLSIHSEKIV